MSENECNRRGSIGVSTTTRVYEHAQKLDRFFFPTAAHFECFLVIYQNIAQRIWKRFQDIDQERKRFMVQNEYIKILLFSKIGTRLFFKMPEFLCIYSGITDTSRSSTIAAVSRNCSASEWIQRPNRKTFSLKHEKNSSLG